VAGLAGGVLIEAHTTGRWQGVVARDARTGATRWRHLRTDWRLLSQRLDQVRVVDDGRAVLVRAHLRGRATLTVLDLASGRVRWQQPVFQDALLETGGQVLLLRTLADRRPIAYRWDTGRRAWQYGPPNCRVDWMAADAALVYLLSQCDDDGLSANPRAVALDRRGRQVWRTDLPPDDGTDEGLRTAELRGGTVRMGETWLNRHTGAVVAPFPAPVPDPARPVSGGNLVVGASSTEVVAEDATTGAERWRVPAPGPWRGAGIPAVADGRVYVAWAYRADNTTAASKNGGGTVALQVLDAVTGAPTGPLRLVTFHGCHHRPPHGYCLDGPLTLTVYAGGGAVVLDDPNHAALVLT
jgi:outer membrane protein assembly factor BamB